MDNFAVLSTANLLAMGVPEEELAKPKEGETPETAFLRVKAAKLYLKFQEEPASDS